MDEGRMMVKSHRVVLANRRSLALTGVVDVISFDLAEVLLETELGMLHLKGKDLHVNRLNLEKGEVDIEGTIDNLAYSDANPAMNKGQGILGRLFG